MYRFLRLLKALMDYSSILRVLEQANDGGLQLLTATKDESNALKVLGYFSMVGLLRVHCLLGDYQAGLDSLLPIDISQQQGLYTTLIGCHLTTSYHYGVANLILARYVDAIREFNKFLVYISRAKQPLKKAPQYEEILKKIDQMYALLAMCLSVCPSQLQLIDENVNSQLMDKYGHKMSRMQINDDNSHVLYTELLAYAWPTFYAPFEPTSGDPREIFTQEELDRYGKKHWAIAYPTFFGPTAPSHVEPVVKRIKFEEVIDVMWKNKTDVVSISSVSKCFGSS